MKKNLKYGLFALLTWVSSLAFADGLPFDLEYSVYLKDKGWSEWEQNGATAGKWNERLEALRIRIVNRDEIANVANCSVHYRAYVPGLGWMNWVKDGDIAGKVEDYEELEGESRRLEAVVVKLENCDGWDVSYRVHIINNDWTESVNGGGIAGTIDESKTLVAFKMTLLPEGCNDTWEPSKTKSQGYLKHLSLAWSEQQQRYVVAGARVFTSQNLSDWDRIIKAGDDYIVMSQVAWGGDRWIGVYEDSFIYWSLDGVNWNKQEIGIHKYYYDVHWSNGLWIITDEGGGMATSSDGINWQSQSVDFSRRYSLVSNGPSWIGYGQYNEPNKIAVSDNGTKWTTHHLEMDAHKIFWDGNQWILISLEKGVFSSDDGINWQFRSSDRPYSSTAIASNGEVSISVGFRGNIFISYDSYHWSNATSFVGNLYDVIWDGQQWLAVGDDGAVIVSADGIHWQDKADGHPHSKYIKQVTGTPHYWVMSAGLWGLYKSSDGFNWQEQYRKPGLSIDRVKWNGQHWLAMATQEQYTIFGEIDDTVPKTAVLLSSEDGTTWEIIYQKNGETFYDFDWDGERWVVLGNKYTIKLNADASQWVEFVHSEINRIKKIRWNGNEWLAIGQSEQINLKLREWNGKEWVAATAPYGDSIYYSKDAINWSIASHLDAGTFSNDRWNFYEMASDGNIWVVVAGANDEHDSAGMILTSNDGLQWRSQIMPNARELRAVAYNGSRWVVGGYFSNVTDGVYSSDDGRTWEKANTPYIDSYGLISEIGWNGYQWLAVGAIYPGMFLTSTDGVSWQEHTIKNSRGFKNIAWNGNQWLLPQVNGEALYLNQCSDNPAQNSCITEAAHYQESNAMLHIEQLLLQGPFGTQQIINDISLKYVPNLIPLAFENEYLNTPENDQLCTDETAILSLNGELKIPSVKYTPQLGEEKTFNDVIFQMDEASNTFNFKSAVEAR